MRIALLHPDLGIGGAERLVVDAASALQARGHQVTIFTSRHDPRRSFEATRDGTLDVRVRGRWLPAHILNRLRAPCAIARMRHLARAAARSRTRFDVFVCDLVPHVIPLLRRLGRAPVVLYCHFPDLLLAPQGGAWRRAYRGWIDRAEAAGTARADCVLVNSAFTAAVFQRTFPRLTSSPVIVRPAIDATAFPLPGRDPLAVAPSAAETVAVLSRFAPDKNLGLALDAFAALRDRIAPARWATARLVIAGGYDARLRECRETVETLEAQVRRLGLTDQVTLRRSPSDRERRALLSRCRCVLFTPPAEHFGFVPIEAMAAARPVIAVNRGGPTETVVDGATGLLCPPTAEAFAAALKRLLIEPDTADRMGRAGRERVERYFSLAAFGAQFESILVALVAGPRVARPKRIPVELP